MSKNEWWKTFFDENYVRLWTERGDLVHTKKEVNFLIKAIPLKKTDLILDLCCGHGRHSIELAKRGYIVKGLDYSSYELGLARKEASKKKLLIDFRRGDARNFEYPKKFEVIINMFSAFGYGSKEDDKQIISSVSRNLKKGGSFFIDLVNLPWIWRNYRSRKTEFFQNMSAKITRDFDFLNSVNREKRIITTHRGKKTYQIAMRLYSLSSLSELLESCGLKVKRYWGSFSGKPYGLVSKRMLVLAKKA